MQFENRKQTSLTLVIEPWGERHDIPHLATAGVRYVLNDGAEDRCSSVVSDDLIEFWCNADSYEVEVVAPSPFERLSWDICVNGGWCGGLVDDKPTSVSDLLPASGIVTAQAFASLAVRADGWPKGDPVPEKHLRWLEDRFVEHLGAASVDVAALRKYSPRPFGEASG